MQRSRSWSAGLLVVADAGLLVALWPDLPSLAHGLAAPRQWLATAGPDHVATALAGAGLWLAAAWVAVGLLAATLGRLPGATGSVAAAFARRALPLALRRIVIGSAGLGVLLTPLSPLAAGAQSPDVPGGRPAATADPLPGPSWPGSGPVSPRAVPVPLPPGPSWPGSAAPRTAPKDAPTPMPTPSSTTPSLPSTPRSTPSAHPTPTEVPKSSPTPRSTSLPPAPRTSAPTHAAPAPRPTTGPTNATGTAGTAGTAGTTTVRAGDCLWLLAAHRLGPRADDTDVAAYLPDLYAANRDVIGDDPGLVRPGQVLTLPAPDPSHPSQESP